MSDKILSGCNFRAKLFQLHSLGSVLRSLGLDFDGFLPSTDRLAPSWVALEPSRQRPWAARGAQKAIPRAPEGRHPAPRPVPLPVLRSLSQGPGIVMGLKVDFSVSVVVVAPPGFPFPSFPSSSKSQLASNLGQKCKVEETGWTVNSSKKSSKNLPKYLPKIFQNEGFWVP